MRHKCFVAAVLVVELRRSLEGVRQTPNSHLSNWTNHYIPYNPHFHSLPDSGNLFLC